MTWPSTYAAGTLGYMVDRIIDELGGRSDLSSQIQVCITDAILAYQKHRFRFNEGYDYNFSTVIGQEFYSFTAGQVPFEIDYLALQIGTARFDIGRRAPEDIDLLSQSGTQRGQPQVYAFFNEQIRFYPVPSAVYPVIVAAHEILAAPAALSTTGNRWMTDGERMIRSRAKFELSLNYGVDFPELMQRMNPDTGAAAEAFSELKAEAAKVTGTGRVRPTQF